MSARRILLPALAIALGIYYWWTAPRTLVIPAATWRIGLGTDVQQGQNYDDLPGEAPIRVSFRCEEPCYVYVFSHSSEDGTLLMFPSPSITSDCDNPLPAGHTVLPGRREGEEVAWRTRPGIVGLTTYITIAAKAPVPELDELGPKLRRWTNTVFPDHSMGVMLPSSGADFAGKPRQELPLALLREAAALANVQVSPNGPMQLAQSGDEIYLSAWKVRERKADKDK